LRRQRPAARGQTIVEFALVAPVFLLVVFATVDFGGYFGSRLSVENAARAGSRFAVVQACGATSSTACGSTAWTSAANPNSTTTIEGVIRAAASYPLTIPNVDCTWSGGVPGSGLASIPSGQTGCISIAYFNISHTAQTLCAYWSVSSGWQLPNSAYNLNGAGGLTACVVAGNLIQITVMAHYSTLTPVPALPSSALDTTATIQLTEED
jgi:hypothetical protein